LAETDQIDQLVRIVPARKQAALQANQLADGELLLESRGLQHHSDTSAVGRSARRRVEAEHVGGTGVPGAITLENFHDGCLAGTVRAQQREDLAVTDREAHPVDSVHVPVRLGQVLNHDAVRITAGRIARPRRARPGDVVASVGMHGVR
jgi:hypothetical protein